MKRKNILLCFLLFINYACQSQTLERNSGESKEDFIKRAMPTGSVLEIAVTEHKFNSPGKKIVYFYKKLVKDSTNENSKGKQCIDAGILIPESETSKKYLQQMLFVDCNSDYNCTIESAEVKLNKKNKNFELNISFVQLNRVSTRLIIKAYKTFLIKQSAGTNNFTIEEVRE
ncbi:MAG: hypothetical protein ACHQNT_01500 [Bacteroidia bacterium]